MERRLFEKYLRRCGASPEKASAMLSFQRAVVIPACDEMEELPGTLASLAAALRRAPLPVVCVVVVNHPAGSPEKPSLELLELLESYRNEVPLYPIYAPGLKGGVGEARKIGMDAFVASCTPETADDAIIFSLDADTHISPDYFIDLEEAFLCRKDAGFCTIGFSHRPAADKETEAAIREYERYLHSYVESLRRAGSPYAFMSIGSAFAVRVKDYIRAGGMKEKKAGEDFYFLQELAKCGRFFEVEKALVFPSSRRSGRNPFGTGPALEKLLAKVPLGEPNKAAFAALKILLDHVKNSPLDDANRFLDPLPNGVKDFLVSEKFPSVWERIAANTPKDHASCEAAFHRWFDGLKSLRFLHALSAKNSGK